MTRDEYAKWRTRQHRKFKRRGIRLQVSTLTKLQSKINNARRGLNERKNHVREWSFHEVATLICDAIGTPCRYCKEIMHWRKIALDHKRPVDRGGSNAISNVQPICRRCNRAKHTLSHKKYKRLLKFLFADEEYKKEIWPRIAFGGRLYSQSKSSSKRGS